MKIKIIATVLTVSFCVNASADKVTLKSGSFLTGEAGVIQDGKLKFTSADLGAIDIAIASIASLESDRDHTIQYLDNSCENKKVTVLDGELAVPQGGKLEKLDMAKIKSIDPVFESWHGSVNLSGTATRGNTVAETATITADLNRRWEKDRLTANGGYYFAQSGDSKETKQKTTSRFELSAQEDHFWKPKFYSYLNGKYEVDKIMSLEYRWRVGAGVGYQWLENRDFGFGKLSFSQEIGASYVGEKFEHKDEDNFGTFRYAHHLNWEIAAVENLSFTHNLEYLPAVDEWTDNYLLDTDMGIVYAFSANWQLLGKIEWDYQRKVAPGVKHSDIRYILGLGYKW